MKFLWKKKINVYFEEILSSQKKHKTVYLKNFPYENSDKFNCPMTLFFLEITEIVQKIVDFYQVGYVHKDNLVGKAQFIFFSTDKSIGNFFAFWKWNKSIRFDRFFKKIN